MCAAQLSARGLAVATVDKHKVIGWSLQGPTKAPLMLRHTKAFTVRTLAERFNFARVLSG